MTTSPGDRFPELSRLLTAYEWTGEVFDDTLESPGRALASYIRTAARNPDRVVAAVREIDDLLEVGLFSDEIADDVDLLPHIEPPQGASVEDCLRIIRRHLKGFLAAPPAPDPTVRPQTSWEWRERFPALAHLLGACFHQDFDLEYESREEAVDDYLSGEPREYTLQAAAEINDLLALTPSDDDLEEATGILGLDLEPPDGVSLQRWLTDVRDVIVQHA